MTGGRLKAILLAAALSTPAHAADVSNYSMGSLLATCIEADSDARDGIAAEIECEQYVTGFTDAFALLAEAAGEEVCLPEQNRPDEVRWAFTKWAMQNYGQRTEPAAVGLKTVLEHAFACP